MTFHKLGLDIISKETGKRPDVFEDLTNVIDKYFRDVVDKELEIMKKIVTYFGIFINIPRDLAEFENLGEVHDYYRSVDYETIKSKVEQNLIKNETEKITIKKEKVKSVQEVMIANYLFLNGIEYSYERQYPIDTSNQYRRQYKPDFYLDDYDIYLEHFGISVNNRLPWLTEIEEKKYLEGMEWKRKLHKENKTTLIETYSYYVNDGQLFDILEGLLKSHGVVYKSMDFNELYKVIFEDSKSKQFSEFKKLIQSFIGLFKSRGFCEADFELLSIKASSNKNSFFAERNNVFLSIVKPIYIDYQNELKSLKQIDFNDMINMATDIVINGDNQFKYKYIIIDEYQDISISRFNLIREIRNKTNARIMAVGDDWQSIYRFAGSDIDLFTNFSSYLGFSEIMKIEKTYRNSQELIDISGKFIMENSKQIVKELNSDKNHTNPIKILGYIQDFKTALISAIEEIVNLHGERAEIMILGRNNFDIDVLADNEEFTISRKAKMVLLTYEEYPDLKLQFLTTHRSKGLESENVIVINLENKLVGFPNQISDDPVLSMVITDSDEFMYAEERRLFYVAITRTKNCTYLISPEGRESIFVEELEKLNVDYNFVTQEDSKRNNPNCPTCQKGHLVIRENQKDKTKFLGCTNFPICETSFKNIEILEENIKCYKCGGYMVRRTGTYGIFYGCTNFPLCRQTIRVDSKE
jgi:DNA helicase-4